MHKYFTQTIPITRHNYTIDAIPPVNPSLGRGKGKMGEIVRKKSKAGHVRTLENGHRGRQVKGGLFRNTADRGQVDVATPGYIR